MAKTGKPIDDYRVLSTTGEIVLRTNSVDAALEAAKACGGIAQQARENLDKKGPAWLWVAFTKREETD